MINTLINIFKIRELRNKIFFTIFILMVYRLGVQIPVPGIDFYALKVFMSSFRGGGAGDPLFEYFNFFAGGAFDNMSIFALGIMPYITTSIIMQLLLLIIPSLKRISQEEGGRRKISQFTRIGTIPVCILQSFLAISYLSAIPDDAGVIVVSPKILFYIVTILVTTTGTIVLMWFGEQITQKGIGNGISLVIFAGIVARMPGALKELFDKVSKGSLDIPILLFVLIMFVFVIALVIFEQQGQRKIPVNYSKRVIGRKMYGAPSTYLPFKINPSGVIPIIFANSILIFPQSIGKMFGNLKWMNTLGNLFRHGSVPYLILYSLLIIFFAYFYTQVTLNPTEIAKNIRENGGSIPGIPVNKVEEYLLKILNRIVLPGSIFLAFIAIIPTIVVNLIPDFPSSFAYLLGGTSLIIIVGVALDTMSQIESHLKMHHQDGLTKKGRIRSRNF